MIHSITIYAICLHKGQMANFDILVTYFIVHVRILPNVLERLQVQRNSSLST